MFGELRSVLAEPGLDEERWHAWLADESWVLEQLHEQELYSVRQMQQRHDMRVFSVPDEVISAMIYGKPLPGIYTRQPERLWLCAHLEIRPDVRAEADWQHRARLTLIEAIDRLDLRALCVMTCHTAGLREFLSGTEAEVLAHPSLEGLEELALWGDHDPHQSASLNRQARDLWISALATARNLGQMVRCRIRQMGLTGEHLELLSQATCWPRLEALDLSYNAFDQSGLHHLVREPPGALRELVMFGYEEQVTSAYWEAVYKALPKIESVSASRHVLESGEDTSRPSVMQPHCALARVLLMRVGDQGTQQHLREADVITLGRGVALRDATRYALRVADSSVARRHARLLHYRGRYYVVDLHSTNGSYVGEHLVPPGKPVRVQMGQNVMIGRTIVRLET